jgi:hypothetical protein
VQEFVMAQQRYRGVGLDGVQGEQYQIETNPPIKK